MSFWAQAGFSLGADFLATTTVKINATKSTERSIFNNFLKRCRHRKRYVERGDQIEGSDVERSTENNCRKSNQRRIETDISGPSEHQIHRDALRCSKLITVTSTVGRWSVLH